MRERLGLYVKSCVAVVARGQHNASSNTSGLEFEMQGNGREGTGGLNSRALLVSICENRDPAPSADTQVEIVGAHVTAFRASAQTEKHCCRAWHLRAAAKRSARGRPLVRCGSHGRKARTALC